MRFLKFQTSLLLVLLAISRLTAGYSSIYVFGDGVCTTTATLTNPSLYYGPQQGQKRWSNGPVWTEILSPLQGVPYNAAKNNSYFGHTSAALNTSVNNFTQPADAATSLFIVWSNDADFVDLAQDNSLWQASSLNTWNNIKIPAAINNLTTAINTLYAKGARVIVMPNAVDITAIPLYLNTSNDKSFFRARIEAYNSQFLTATTNLMNANPGLVIYRPNVYSFFNDVIANPGFYGFTNATNAATGSPLLETSFTGPGANYVFWDFWHPTTKFQNLLANFINQSIPVPDTTPPVLTLPGNLLVEATGPAGAVVTFSTSALDAVSGSRPTTATPASGSTFPLGQTTVNVTATDAAGNTANGNFTVTVRDTTPPTLPTLTNRTREATGPSGAVVTFSLGNATDAVSGNRTCTATPPSGSTFPIGTTTVSVSASDAAGNPASGSFKVTVVNMRTLLQNVSITPGGVNSAAISGLIQGGAPGGQVILQASTDMGVSDPWQDISTITLDSNGNKSFGPIADPQGPGLSRDFFRIKLLLTP